MLLPLSSYRDRPFWKSFGVFMTTFIFGTAVLLYRLPRNQDRKVTSQLRAFAPSISRYNKNYRHSSSYSPATQPPSVNFLDLNDINQRLPCAHYDPFSPDGNSWHGSRKPCLGPWGVVINNNPDDVFIAHSVKSLGLSPTKKLVHEANCKDLHTVTIRPCLTYGERDN